MQTNLFVCGKVTTYPAWELCGVFTTEAKAVAACLDDFYFVGPVEVDKVYTESTVDNWPGHYYPLVALVVAESPTAETS